MAIRYNVSISLRFYEKLVSSSISKTFSALAGFKNLRPEKEKSGSQTFTHFYSLWKNLNAKNKNLISCRKV